MHYIKVARSFLSSTVEAGQGLMGTSFPNQPEKALQLYEFEPSPFCRRVREVATLLNLDIEIYPCPKNGTRFRPTVLELGGKLQFPFFVDQNTGDQLYESDAIIEHLIRHYGQQSQDQQKYLTAFGYPLRSALTTLPNGVRGLKANKSNATKAAPEKLLHLWSFEASPYSRLVREVLTELEIPYVLHNVAKEQFSDMGTSKIRPVLGHYHPVQGGKRAQIYQMMGGKVQVPYLKDPNTDVDLFESDKIIQYLKQQYA